jgi:alpha-tubulin suppressor-like RCC1 family protein
MLIKKEIKFMYLKKLLLTSSVLLAGISQATTMPMPISGGSSACVALCKDNKVYAWGQNMNKLDTTSTNILCLDTTIAGYEKKGFYSTPNLVDTKGIRFIQVDAGSGLTISGISDKGVLYYWGMAYDSTNKYKYKEISPVECGQLKGYDEDGNPGGKYLGNVKKVAGSTNGFIALLKDNTVVISEFFNDVDTARNEQGARIDNVVDICAGDNSFFALTSDGIIYSTGSFDGHGSKQSEKIQNELKPVLLENTKNPLKDVVAIGSGDCSSFAVTKDGKAYGWGNGGWGGCTGTGHLGASIYANPIIAGDYAKISGLDYLSNVKQIDGGRGYGAAVTFDGYLLYWGNNEGNGGVAGVDTLANEFHTPIFLTYEDGSIVNDAVAIECGDNFGFVVNNKKQYFAFGLNDFGQCGVGSDAETIHYLHPMSFDCELATLCPSVRLLGDTVSTCRNRETAIEALTSSTLEEKDYTLSWYLNEDKLNETSNICVADSEGVYKVVMTPTDSICPVSTDYIYVKMDKTIESIETETLLPDSNDIKNQDLLFNFKISSAKETNIIIYSDEDCTNAIDTLSMSAGENIVSIPGSYVSIENDKAKVWLKEIVQTTLLPNSEFKNSSNGTFTNQGMMLKTANNTTLKSFNTKFKSFIGTTDISITPALYRYLPNASLPTEEMELVATGSEQKFTIDEAGTVCTVKCQFEIPNNGIYVVGMTTKGTATLIVESIKNSNSAIFENPIHDANGLGIDWVGSTNGSYSSPSPAIDNCYFDLVFTDIEVSKCGAVELVSKIEIDKTDCINTPSVNDNVEGEKYDIFGRKIVNVQPQTIYIMNGKKYILSK